MDNNREIENTLKDVSGQIVVKVINGDIEVTSDIADIDTLIFLSRSLASVIHVAGNKINQPIGRKLDLLEEINELTRKWLCLFADRKIQGKEMIKHWMEESR